jgi:hypothetical protein
MLGLRLNRQRKSSTGHGGWQLPGHFVPKAAFPLAASPVIQRHSASSIGILAGTSDELAGLPAPAQDGAG